MQRNPITCSNATVYIEVAPLFFFYCFIIVFALASEILLPSHMLGFGALFTGHPHTPCDRLS